MPKLQCKKKQASRNRFNASKKSVRTTCDADQMKCGTMSKMLSSVKHVDEIDAEPNHTVQSKTLIKHDDKADFTENDNHVD